MRSDKIEKPTKNMMRTELQRGFSHGELQLNPRISLIQEKHFIFLKQFFNTFVMRYFEYMLGQVIFEYILYPTYFLSLSTSSPLPFFKMLKKCPDLGKKCPNYIHLLVKFLIYKAVLSISRKKIFEIFPCRSFFRLLQIICLSKCHYFQKPPLS